MSRAKDPQIVAESQEVFVFVKKILTAITSIIIIAAIGYFGYRYFSERAGTQNRQPITQKSSPWESLPLCAGGEYDLSGLKIGDERVVPFRADCLTAVKLPEEIKKTAILDPNEDVRYKFLNGKDILDGPAASYQNWVSKPFTGNEAFKLYGLNKPGNLKIIIKERN